MARSQDGASRSACLARGCRGAPAGASFRSCGGLSWRGLHNLSSRPFGREASLQRVHEIDDVLRGGCWGGGWHWDLPLLLSELLHQDGAVAILQICRIEVFQLA